MSSLRENLQDLRHPKACTHTGLWLDRYFEQARQSEDGDASAQAKQSHLDRASLTIKVPPGYDLWLKQRLDLLRAIPDTIIVEANVIGRLIVGLGASSVWENNISLHHTWGVPVVPGSAFKGLASSYSHRFLNDSAWRKEMGQQPAGESHAALFGTTEGQGLVVFHDALWRPSSNGHNGLDLDVLTVHHQDYYQQGNTTSPPADWDSPVPVPFLSSSGSFIFALTGPESWRDAAFEILKLALQDVGVGAKTSSGYGRMELRKILSETEQRREDTKRSLDSFDYDGASAPGSRNVLEQKLEQLYNDTFTKEERETCLRIFFENAAGQSKNVKKNLKQSFEKIIDSWTSPAQKDELQVIFAQSFQSQELPKITVKKQDERDWESIASRFIAHLSGSHSTLADALEEVDAEYIYHIFPQVPSNKEMRPLQQAVAKQVSAMFPGQNDKQLQSDLKKYIKKLLK
jgi:CRISPR-associated protein Cmr6